jgi:hypothetical protein
MAAVSVAVYGFALVACTSSAAHTSTPATTATATPTQSSSDALNAALDKLDYASYDYTSTLVDRNSTTNQSGSVDGRTRVRLDGDIDVAGTVDHLDFVIVEDAFYFKADLGAGNAQFGLDPTKWMKVDLTRLTHFTGPPDLAGPDVMEIHGLFVKVVTVTRTDDTHFAGTIDLTAATSNNSDPDTMAAAGAAAKTAPFTVTLDSQGRIADLGYTIPGTKSVFTAHYTHYGSPSPITAPGSAIAMPDSVYSLINN